MKWERERIENEKLVKSIGLYGTLGADSLQSKSKTLLPPFKNRQSLTRAGKTRLRKVDEDSKRDGILDDDN